MEKHTLDIHGPTNCWSLLGFHPLGPIGGANNHEPVWHGAETDKQHWYATWCQFKAGLYDLITPEIGHAAMLAKQLNIDKFHVLLIMKPLTKFWTHCTRIGKYAWLDYT